MNLITIPIKIGANVFIGARAFIMPGITVGDYAIVGANSTIIKNVESYNIVAGNPARFIKKRELKS